MKAAVIGPFPPFRGGIAQFSLRLLQVLRKEYPQDEFIPVSYSRLYPSLLFPGTSQIQPEGYSKDLKTMDWIDSTNFFSWPVTRRRIRNLDPDRIILQWWHPFFAPCLMGAVPPEIPACAVCHNVIPHESFPLAGRLAGRFLRRMSTVVVHGKSDLEEAGSLKLEARLLKLYHPIYDQYGKPESDTGASKQELGYSRDTSLVLFFGLVRPYKGLLDLIRAMDSLPRDIQLLVVGECYADRKEILDSIRDLDLADRVRWIDRFVPDDEVSVFFNAADVVALPYRNATQSGVAQIALSFNKVMVLTNTGGLSELLDEGSTGYMAEPWSPSSLASSVEKAIDLARDPKATARIQKKASEFSWKNYAQQLISVI